jgi:hypothetical protein
VDLCFLLPGVPAPADAAGGLARRLAATHDVTLALCDERLAATTAARSGEPLLASLEQALGRRFDAAIAFDWTSTVHLFSVDAACHAYWVDGFAHEQMGSWQAERIAAQLSYDLPVDFVAAAPWVREVLADLRPDARCELVTAGAPAPAAAAEPVVVALEGDALDGPLSAMAAGSAVVASTALRGVGDVVRHGENGFLVEPDDDRGAQRFVALLERDAGLLARVRAAARETAAAWPSWDDAAREFEAALGRLMAQPAPAAARWPVRLMADAMAGVAVMRADQAALTAHVERLERDEAYRAGVAIRDAWRRVPGVLRALLKPLLRLLRGRLSG